VKRQTVEMAWILWLSIGAVSFAVLEGIALRTRKLPTLSRTLQRWIGVDPPLRYGGYSPLAFAAAGALLAWHLYQVEREIAEAIDAAHGL
jgi:hypothetical protein